MATIARNVNYVHFKRRKAFSSYGAPEPMPEVYRTTFIHLDTPSSISMSATELNRFICIRINSIYDPNYSWGGNSALGYKTMGRFYSHYFVRKCWIRAQIIDGNEVQTTDVHTVMIPITNSDSVPTGLLDLTGIKRHFPRARVWRKSVAANRAPIPRTSAFSPWEYTQVGNPYDDPANYGLFLDGTSTSGNPDNFYGVLVGVARDNLPWTEAALTIGLKITVWFDTYCLRQPSSEAFAADAANLVPPATWFPALEGLEEADDDGAPTLMERDTNPSGALADIAGHTDD